MEMDLCCPRAEACPFLQSSETGHFEILDICNSDNQMDLWAEPSSQPTSENQFILFQYAVDSAEPAIGSHLLNQTDGITEYGITESTLLKYDASALC